MKAHNCCVLIPYYNAGDDLIRSILSIEESDGNIADIIVIDDGSERVRAIDTLSRYRGKLNVIVHELQRNQGIEHALNYGLEKVRNKYKFIARLDCGDMCLNSRLAKQLAAMESYPDCYLLGSRVEFISPQGKYLFTLNHPTSPQAIRKRMRINAALTHPSIILRSSLIDLIGPYPTNFPAAEDYAFFFNALTAGVEIRNLPEVLVRCIADPNGISSRKRRTQIASRLRIMASHYDFSWLATYGILRSTALFFTPRALSIGLNKLKMAASPRE